MNNISVVLKHICLIPLGLLTLTNLNFHPVKDQEQYKLEIVNLKAKKSMCCGEDVEVRATEGVNENTAKLTQQFRDVEQRLLATEDKLDDLRYERDTYKAKVCFLSIWRFTITLVFISPMSPILIIRGT